MTRLQPYLYEGVEKDLLVYLYSVMWADISDLVKNSKKELIMNARITSFIYLKKALLDGTVTYKNGVFKGTSSMRLTRELQTFARYDKSTRSWIGIAPPGLAKHAIHAQAQNEEFHRRIQAAIDDIPAKVGATIDSLNIDITPIADQVAKNTDRDLYKVGIALDDDQVISPKLVEEYRASQQISIKNFTEDQSKSMADLIRKNVLSGYNRAELIDMLKHQFNVTESKAKFLARQETSLFISALRNERFKGAGVKVAKWSSSRDKRVVGTPGGKFPKPTEGHGNHYAMHGKYVMVSDPTLYADTIEDVRAGNWKLKSNIGGDNKHAGESYNCRCVYIPVIV